ncbi:MAG TPA: hypothetical protein VJI67_01475, partial [archaeon]|nr:hypothetical protein [archaeon]
QIFNAFSQDDASPLSRVSQSSSGISIDPFSGCPLGCAYCYRNNSKRDALKMRPTRLFSDEELVDALVEHPFFAPHNTVVSICTSSSDPFLAQTRDSTFNIMQLLLDKGYRNPFWIVTKVGVPAGCAERLKPIAAKSRGVVISVCYSGMPASIEPYRANRLGNLEEAREAGAKLSLHFRPIVPGWNDGRENIKRVLEKSAGFDCVCVGGLRLLRGVKESITKVRKLSLQLRPKSEIAKELPPQTLESVLAAARELRLSIPLFLHASCAISYLLQSPDYNATFLRDLKSCNASDCPSQQRLMCRSLEGKIMGDRTRLLRELKLDGQLAVTQKGFVFSKKQPVAGECACVQRCAFESGALSDAGTGGMS